MLIVDYYLSPSPGDGSALFHWQFREVAILGNLDEGFRQFQTIELIFFMKHLHYSVEIAAPVSQVWSIMLSPETYRAWTAAFCEGSYFEGSWDEGSTIRFLSPSGEGMLAEIAENRRHEFISIRQLACIGQGSPEPFAEPAFENYTFQETGEGTTLEIDIDVQDEHVAMFEEMWPRALGLLKGLCE